MFGKRAAPPAQRPAQPAPAPSPAFEAPEPAPAREASVVQIQPRLDPATLFGGAEQRYAEVKQSVFSALVEAVDLTELSKLSSTQVREEITDIVGEIIAMQN